MSPVSANIDVGTGANSCANNTFMSMYRELTCSPITSVNEVGIKLLSIAIFQMFLPQACVSTTLEISSSNHVGRLLSNCSIASVPSSAALSTLTVSLASWPVF